MASMINVLRTCGLLVSLIFYVCANEFKSSGPRIMSLKVDSKICDDNNCKYLLNVRGGEFLGHYSWRLTPVEGSWGGICDVIYPNYEIREVSATQLSSTFEVKLSATDKKIYFCLYENSVRNSPFGGKWVHQGAEYFLDLRNNSGPANLEDQNTDNDDDLQSTNPQWTDLSHDIDVNNLPDTPGLNGEEIKDIEVLLNDKYVPFNELQDFKTTDNEDDKKTYDTTNSIDRFKREIINNSFDKNVQKISENSYKIVDDTIKVATSKVESSQKVVEENYHEVINDMNKKYTRKVDDSEYTFIDDKYKKYTRKVEASQQVADEIDHEFIDDRNQKISRKVHGSHKVVDDMNKDPTPNVEDVYKVIDEIDGEISEDSSKVINRRARQVTAPDMYFTSVKADPIMINIEGLRIEDSDKEPKIVDEGIPSVLADSKVTLRLFGDGLTSRTVIAFTHEEQSYGQPCKFLLKGEYMVKEDSLERKTALFDIVAPAPITESKLYICTKNLKLGVDDPFDDEEKYLHQGTDTYKMFASHDSMLPLWFSLTLILTCLTFSALFSGLNLGLMSLDRTELKIIANTGTEQERKYARAIMPVRDHGNYLLCSILLGNVAVNSTFTILLDELTSGLFAVIFSTLAIVLLGEITPQAICSRHGLMVGARSIMITKAVMCLTAPFAYPISKLLDYFLGEEIGNVYNRERLKELVKVTTDVNDLDKDEVNIISGALELRKKKVSEVMTKLEDVFMLPISSVLDFETMSEIIKSGYSRIPVYEGSRGNILTVLFIKDLAFVDPDDNTPLRTLCQYYENPCNFVFEDVTLDIMFKQFKEGHKGHMAFVHRINNEGEGDPFYETIGLVTLEDVIEEMIQAEIVDETDVFMDNRTKRRRKRPQNKLQDFAAFAERHENQRIHISPQLTLATFQFLSTSVDAFRPDTVSETVLRRLLRQDVIQYIKLKGKTKKDPTTFVFQQGKAVDYFVLILEGRVEVTVGRENLVFEAGPFTYFGVQALTQNVGVAESPTPSAMGSLQNINMDAMLRHTFVPDYSVRAITELYYLTVKRSLYLAAKRATLMEKGALSKGATNEQFDTEVDKHLCNSSSANIPISLISKKLLPKSASSASGSTRNTDDLGSTSAPNKLPPTRMNIIELMQIPQTYAASDALGANSDHYSSKLPQHIEKHWSDTRPRTVPNKSFYEFSKTGPSKSFVNACDTAKYWANYEKERFGRCRDSSKHVANETDPNDCEECVSNNFWMNRSILNKSVCDPKESDHCRKKKTTTFHTDSSLLTIHNLAPPSHELLDTKQEIDYKSIPDTDYKAIQQELTNEIDTFDRYDRLMEFERDTIDYDEWREERLALEKKRVETEQLMLLLQSVDEDLSITGEHKTPSRQVSPNRPAPASPRARGSLASRASPERAPDVYATARPEEHERLLK